MIKIGVKFSDYFSKHLSILTFFVKNLFLIFNVFQWLNALIKGMYSISISPKQAFLHLKSSLQVMFSHEQIFSRQNINEHGLNGKWKGGKILHNLLQQTRHLSRTCPLKRWKKLKSAKKNALLVECEGVFRGEHLTFLIQQSTTSFSCSTQNNSAYLLKKLNS